MFKKCNNCKIEKQLSEYHPDKTGRDGRRSICKVCTNDRIAAKRALRAKGIGITAIQEKTCNKCNETKSISEFFKDLANSDGHYSMCKPCKTAATMAWRKENADRYNKTQRDFQKRACPEKRYGVEIKRRYGCTLEQYNETLAKQEGKCAICNKLHNPLVKKGRLYVDHCHAAGKIRNLLCGACNSMIGYAKDNIVILQNAINYLKGE